MNKKILIVFFCLTFLHAKNHEEEYQKYLISFGDLEAKINVVEYFSFSCPGCLEFHESVFPKIKTKYIDAGKVCWTFRPHPMDLDTIYVMTILGYSKNQQFKYQMFESVMTSQRDWKHKVDNKKKIIGVAKKLGMSAEDIKRAFGKSHYTDVFGEAFYEKNSSKIDGTPTIFVDGEEMEGIPSAEEMEKKIQSCLENLEG